MLSFLGSVEGKRSKKEEGVGRGSQNNYIIMIIEILGVVNVMDGVACMRVGCWMPARAGSSACQREGGAASGSFAYREGVVLIT